MYVRSLLPGDAGMYIGASCPRPANPGAGVTHRTDAVEKTLPNPKSPSLGDLQGVPAQEC